jgi:hypothetical protein
MKYEWAPVMNQIVPISLPQLPRALVLVAGERAREKGHKGDNTIGRSDRRHHRNRAAADASTPQ